MSERPLILVSNDDGWMAEGINRAADALEALGEVWVVAPERERSATSHSITLHKPLRVRKLKERRYWVSGNPADAVYVGVNHVVPRKPDLMVSGINHGANLGDDVSYSGTVGAATEARLLEIPSIAISMTDLGATPDFDGAVEIMMLLARHVLEKGLPDLTLLNVNVPDAYDASQGLRATFLGRRHYGREVEVRADPRGHEYYWIGGTKPVFIDKPGSDVNAARDKVASVSPIRIDMSPRDFVHEMSAWEGLSLAPGGGVGE